MPLAAAGRFFAVFLLRAGVPAHGVLASLAAILIGAVLHPRRWCCRSAGAWACKPLVIAGTILTAGQYLLLAAG